MDVAALPGMRPHSLPNLKHVAAGGLEKCTTSALCTQRLVSSTSSRLRDCGT